ncbi:AT-hook motif nuclear-localized protein [Heracleum sosnowskyi]|uniref:AT-hook motif nuclear-localized protein n=1 Tax=Heracleum sosnowskyi TaxID=360622 RepID=A0AAD8GZ36_9APIA|nr:AT-hook motif nuclear-localized protein [Heracleum sosnowskyi]
MDFRELPAQPPQHHQQPPLYNHQQQLAYNYQQPLVPSQSHFYTPQILLNNDNFNHNISDIIRQQNTSSFHVPQNPLDSPSPSSGFKSTGVSTELAIKRRGRPRKYDNISLHDSDKSSKKRHAGSGKKKLDALGSAGVGFTPHVITVDQGEDIASKIVDFSQQGPRTVCILSANGTIWNVTLRQTAMPSSTKSYEGIFEIITLSGSYSLSDDNGSLNQIGSLSVSLSGPDGQVLGGVVAGELIAATPVQVIVGSFITDSRKLKSGVFPTQPPSIISFGASGPEVSPMKEGSSESLGASGYSQLSKTTGPYCSTNEPMTPLFSNITWENSTLNMHPN